MIENKQLDEQLCRQCRGRCCQGHPGTWSDPERFFTIFSKKKIPQIDELTKIIDENTLALRDLGGILVPAPRNTSQGCFAQEAEGCKYPIEIRPCQCLALVPNIETLLDDHIHCTLPPEYGSGSARENWRPFQGMLKKILDGRPE